MSKESNMCIEIVWCRCNECHNAFYEIANHEIDDCPYCGCDFSVCHPDEIEGKEMWVLVEPKTGNIAVLDEEEIDERFKL